MSIENADKEQIELLNKLIGMNKGKIPVEKRPFLNNAALFPSAREKNS